MRNNTIDVTDLIGKPFAYGGRGPDAYDCYGLVMEVMRRYGVELPDYGLPGPEHTPAAIDAAATTARPDWVEIPSPIPGCLVAIAYPYPGLISHVGVVIDADRFIHARAATGGVTIDRLSSPAWRKRIRGYYKYAGPAVDITPDTKESAPASDISLTSLPADRIPASYNPFCLPVGWKSLPVPLSPGAVIADVINAHFPGISRRACIVMHNRRLDPDWLSPVAAGDHLLLVPRLAGGGGIGDIIRPLAMIAVAALAVYTGGAAAMAMGLFETTMTATATITSLTAMGMFVSAAVGTAVMVAGSMIINALLPPPDLSSSMPHTSGINPSGSMAGTTTYAWGGPQNSWTPDQVIPILYGRMRCGGQIINYYVETNNYTDKQTLYMLLGICEGEVSTPPSSPDEIYLNEDKLSTFDSYQFATCSGTSDQDAISGHEKLHQYRTLSIEVAKRTLISMHFDSDVVTDSSAHARTLSNAGGVTHTTMYYKWPPGAAAFDGTGTAYLYVASSDFDTYDKDFGISLQWIPPAFVGGTPRYYGLVSYSNGSVGWNFFYDRTYDIMAFNVLGEWAFNSSKLLDFYNIDMNDSPNCHHIEVNRWGKYWGIWVDGIQVGYDITDVSLPVVPSGQYFYIGRAYVDSAWRPGMGVIDEVRVIKNGYLHKPGVELDGVYYPLNFTPPTAAYSDDYDFVVATRGECDEITVQVEFPRGLFEVNSSSVLIDHSCEFSIYYRAVGESSWTHVDDYTVTAHQREPVRRQYSITGLARDRYEVRLARISAEETSTLMESTLFWTGLDEILNEALAYPYTALLSLVIDGSERLSGRSPVVSSIWDRGTITVKGSVSGGEFIDSGTMNVASSNPAWAAYDLLTNERYGYQILPSRLDYGSWSEWANWCDDTVDGVTRITLNGIIDSQMSLATALNKICQHGRAQILQAGHKIRVAVEAPVSTPSQAFSAGNIIDKSSTTEFLPRSDRPDIYYIEYRNAAYDYREDKVPIKSAGYDALTRVPVSESIFLWGCTSEDEARRYGLLRMQMSDRLNRIRTWSADVDAIACLPGDIVVLQDEGNSLTFGGRLGDNTGVSDDVVVLDQAITLSSATYSSSTCVIWIQTLEDDYLYTHRIEGPWDTETDTFNINPTSTTKKQGDLFIIGRYYDDVVKYRITNISRNVDCLFNISALEYDSSIYYHSAYMEDKKAI